MDDNRFVEEDPEAFKFIGTRPLNEEDKEEPVQEEQ